MRRLTKKYRQELYEYIRSQKHIYGEVEPEDESKYKDLGRLAEFIIRKKVWLKEREALLDTYSYYCAERLYTEREEEGGDEDFETVTIQSKFEFDGHIFCYQMLDESYLLDKNIFIYRSHELGLVNKDVEPEVEEFYSEFYENVKPVYYESKIMFYQQKISSRPPYPDELFREPRRTKLIEDKRVDIFPNHQVKLKRNMQGIYNRFDLMDL